MRIYSRHLSAAVVVTVLVGLNSVGVAQVNGLQTSETFKPSFIPPEELLTLVGVSVDGKGGLLHLYEGDVSHSVLVRCHDVANLIVLSGRATDVARAKSLLQQFDVAPRQIVIEAKIVEINETKSHEIGMDWDRILRDGLPRVTIQLTDDHNTSTRQVGPVFDHTIQDSDSRRIQATSLANFGEILKLMDESGTGTSRNAPKVLTLNNRRATILDGQRVTYVTRYSSYTNMFMTDSMDAGLTLSVLPSLGESGFLTMEVEAELTNLSGDISGSPIKDGQIIKNTVIVKDGESALLGGFERTVTRTSKRRFPLLGHILPFLFSREVSSQSVMRSFIVLTPHVVDLAAIGDPEQSGEQLDK